MTALAPYTVWLDAVPRPGWRQMAIDQALLERAGAGERWLRLYRFEPCLSFGRHEPAAQRYDRGQIRALGLPVVRRPTGGRAVWHAGELTYAVAAPAAALGPLRQAYRAIHELLREALADLGAATVLAPDDHAAPVDGGACFARAAGGEVLVAGRKVAGSAQLREQGAMLQHGSILLEADQSTVTAVTRTAAPADGSAPLARLLGRPVAWAEVAEAVVGAAARRWGAPAARVTDAPALLAASDAHTRRYRSAAWTWHPDRAAVPHG